MKLNIQMFGGRGANSSKKTYTNKDIIKVKDDNGNIEGYKLKDHYLLKNYPFNSQKYFWVISEKRNITGYDDFKRNYITVENAKEGKEKLIELANRKNGGK